MMKQSPSGLIDCLEELPFVSPVGKHNQADHIAKSRKRRSNVCHCSSPEHFSYAFDFFFLECAGARKNLQGTVRSVELHRKCDEVKEHCSSEQNKSNVSDKLPDAERRL